MNEKVLKKIIIYIVITGLVLIGYFGIKSLIESSLTPVCIDRYGVDWFFEINDFNRIGYCKNVKTCKIKFL